MSAFNFFYRKLEENARRFFPSLQSISDLSWDHAISPYEIRLPKSVLATAQAAITALYNVSRRPEFERQLEVIPGVSDVSTKQNSILMAYDFHTDDQGGCSLVEINTNASGFMLSTLLNLTHDETTIESFAPLNDLFSAFQEELRLSGRDLTTPTCALADDDLAEQKMMPEFLMYRDWLNARGWKCELVEAKDFTAPLKFDFIYNRTTDFFLEDPAHEVLRNAFIKNTACISPHPKEYWRLADKQRLVQFSEPGFLERAGANAGEAEAIRKVLIPSFQKSDFASSDEIWNRRRSLFFKPKRSHGGKSVYRGESVSRKVFERLMSEDILIQNYVPAQKMPVSDPRSVLSNWKFDVRFYAYADHIHLVAARLYQGQVTNFSSALGGYTLVRF